MSRYVLGAGAVLDLEDIWDYVASDSMEAADQWIASCSTRSRRSRACRVSVTGARILRIIQFYFGLCERT